MADIETTEPTYTNPLSGGAIAGIIIGTIGVCLLFLLFMAYKGYKDMQIEEARAKLEHLSTPEDKQEYAHSPSKGAIPKTTTTAAVTATTSIPTDSKTTQATRQYKPPPTVSYIKQATDAKPKPYNASRPAVLDVSTIDVAASGSFENPLFGKFPSPTLVTQKSTELFVDPDDGKTKINIDGIIEELDEEDYDIGYSVAPSTGDQKHVTFDPVLDIASEQTNGNKKKIVPVHTFSFDSDSDENDNEEGNSKVPPSKMNGETLLTLGVEDLMMLDKSGSLI